MIKAIAGGERASTTVTLGYDLGELHFSDGTSGTFNAEIDVAFAGTSFSNADLSALVQGHTIDGVYYIDGDQFYIGLGWDADLTPFTFQRNGGTMVIHGDISGLGQEITNFSHVSN